MEIKEAIEYIQDINSLYFPDARRTILSFLSKIQDAEMPKKKDRNKENHWSFLQIEGYNQCHDDFLAYHLKKMGEKDK